jgi:hypothetical protein
VTPAPPAGEPLVYRPLSGLAIASVVLSGLFALALLAAGVAALVRSSPPLMSTWVLLLPTAGVVLSLAAQWRIRRSEGTLAGAALARWGLWLGLLAGLGYVAYYLATGLAVQQQANHFLMDEGEDTGFFPHLLKGGAGAGDPTEVNAAFLLTQHPGRRLGISPDDRAQMESEFDRPIRGSAGLLSMFRGNETIRAALEAGREGSAVEPLGVRGWGYENNGYWVARDYRITTPEMVLEVAVTVTAENDPSGGARKWYVDWLKTRKLDETSRLTPLGQAMRLIRYSAAEALGRWVQGLNEHRPAKPPRDLTKWDDLHVVHPHDKRTAAQIRELARKGVHDVLSGAGQPGATVNMGEQPQCPWKEVDGRIRLELNFSAPAVMSQPGAPEYLAEGRLFVETKKPLDPLHPGGPLDQLEWRVVSYRLERIIPGKGMDRKKMMDRP